jgi:hypothetical protein
MNTKIINCTLLLISAAAIGSFLAACAEMEANNTKSLLLEAGFKVRTPETARQKEMCASLPAYKIECAKIHGKVFYVFKDEKAGSTYVGGEAEHQRYKQLCAERHAAQAAEEEMNPSLAVSWNNQWGPRVF